MRRGVLRLPTLDPFLRPIHHDYEPGDEYLILDVVWRSTASAFVDLSS